MKMLTLKAKSVTGREEGNFACLGCLRGRASSYEHLSAGGAAGSWVPLGKKAAPTDDEEKSD